MENILKDIQGIKDEVVKIRRDLHKIPEPGFKEIKTSEYIMSKLKEYGIKKIKRMAGTGLVATIGSGTIKKTIMLRADMDGVPVQEENKVDYKSINKDWMHACGHDGHMAILLSVIKVLSKHGHELKGNVKFVFQPAEEKPGGADPMIKEGVLEDPRVDAAAGLHIWNDIPCGKVGIRSGPLLASVDWFRIKIFGKGGHGAMPHLGVDAIVVASQVINIVQTIISREVDPLDPAVLTIGQINGGSSYNVIADEVEMIGTIRVLKKGLNKVIRKKMDRILKDVTSGMDARYSIDYNNMYPVTVNDEKITGLIYGAAEETLGKKNVCVAERTMGGEDMAFYLQKVPGSYFFLGSSNIKKGFSVPHHSSNFNFDEDCMLIGAEIFVRAVLDYFH